MYPLEEKTRLVWEAIRSVVKRLHEHLDSRQYVLAVAGGQGAPEFPPALLIELRAIAEEHWTIIEKTVPEPYTSGVDLAKRDWWDALLQDESESRTLRRVRWVFFGSLGNAAAYVLHRDRTASLGNNAKTDDLDRQGALKAYIRYAINRRDAMRELIRDTPPDSRVRHLSQEDVLPRYTRDVAQGRLNRAIAESRRNGDIAILGPRLEAVENALRHLAEKLPEYPQSNIAPAEIEPLNEAINVVFPYLEPCVNGETDASVGGAQTRPGDNRRPRGTKARRRVRRTVPDKRHMEAYRLHLAGKSYREIGKQLHVSHETARQWTNLAKEYSGEKRQGKSVRAQALPTDRRDQPTV